MSEVTKEQIIEKHLKSYLSKNYPENLISEYVVKAYTEWEWISNAMDEWGQLQVNKNLHKPAVIKPVCECDNPNKEAEFQHGLKLCTKCRGTLPQTVL